MSAHTPTPWLWDSEGFVFKDDKTGTTVFLPGDSIPAAERAANAELVARACNCHDELLEALKTYVEHFGDPLKVALPAIAKAEGRS